MLPEPGGFRAFVRTAFGRLWIVVRVVALAWLGLVALLAFTQRSIIYYPSREDADSMEEEARSKGFEAWQNAEGDTIGYRSLAARDDPRPPLAVVIFHGNAGHALHRTDYAPVLRANAPDRAVSVYILEYPGYGARPGNPSEDAFLGAASEALGQVPANSPLVILGESIGTGVACAAAAMHPSRVAGLLLLTPFDSLSNVAQHHYPLLPVRWIMRDRYPSEEWLKNYRGPAAFILAENDSVVPHKFGRKLHDTYAGRKKLITAGQADHNDLLHTLPAEAWQEALDFLVDQEPESH